MNKCGWWVLLCAFCPFYLFYIPSRKHLKECSFQPPAIRWECTREFWVKNDSEFDGILPKMLHIVKNHFYEIGFISWAFVNDQAWSMVNVKLLTFSRNKLPVATENSHFRANGNKVERYSVSFHSTMFISFSIKWKWAECCAEWELNGPERKWAFLEFIRRCWDGKGDFLKLNMAILNSKEPFSRCSIFYNILQYVFLA